VSAVHDPRDPSLVPRLLEEEIRRLAAYGAELRLAPGDTRFVVSLPLEPPPPPPPA
jgi:hypothetical protein